MKNTFTALILFVSAMVGIAGVTSSNLITYASTGGTSTNTGTPVLIGTAYIATVPTFVISDGGTATTNALTVFVQYGIDTNYYTTVATYTKATTNAAEGIVSPSGITLSIYAQTKVVTTNAVTVGTKAISYSP